MRPVKSIRNPEDRRELHHDIPFVGIELGKAFVSHFWMALPVVPGDVCDNFFFVLSETEQFGIADEVVRMTVVLGVGDKQPYLMEECRRFKIDPFFRKLILCIGAVWSKMSRARRPT